MKTSFCLFIILSLIGIESIQARDDIIMTIQDGGHYGVWGYWQYCPPGSYAAGYNMKVEPFLGHGESPDDTAVNGIKLICLNVQNRARVMDITSVVADYGSWKYETYCPSGFINRAQLRNEPPQGSGDDTGTNDVTFICSDGQILKIDSGHTSGVLGPLLTCPGTSVICGIQTRIEPPLGGGDDTGLNGANFACCAMP